MITNTLNLYFCPECSGKYLEQDNILTECPKCHSKLIAKINKNTVKVILDAEN